MYKFDVIYNIFGAVGWNFVEIHIVKSGVMSTSRDNGYRQQSQLFTNNVSPNILIESSYLLVPN
jgi:hypothetical protein